MKTFKIETFLQLIHLLLADNFIFKYENIKLDKVIRHVKRKQLIDKNEGR